MQTIRQLVLFITFFSISTLASGQKLSIAENFENKPLLGGYWKDNNNVTFQLDSLTTNQYSPKSKVCLKVRWESIPASKPWCWFTDIKIDSLRNPAMADVRKQFGDKIWFSFWCKSTGDSLWVQPLALTKDHKGKWGAKKMIPIAPNKWVFVKFKFADLEYENWGKFADIPNFASDDIKCFEIGLRNGQTVHNGYVEALFDNVMITNYEPKP